jgi:hypothetical protein
LTSSLQAFLTFTPFVAPLAARIRRWRWSSSQLSFSHHVSNKRSARLSFHTWRAAPRPAFRSQAPLLGRRRLTLSNPRSHCLLMCFSYFSFFFVSSNNSLVILE